MSNPYQIPPGSFDDEMANLPAGIQNFPRRRSSYASVTSGSGNFARPTNYAQLLHPIVNLGGDPLDMMNTPAAVLPSGLRMPRGTHADHLRHAADGIAHFESVGSPLYQLLASSRSDNPRSFAFDPLLRARSYENYGAGPTTVTSDTNPLGSAGGPSIAGSNSGFFTPSYLSESVYVQRLESQYLARARAASESHAAALSPTPYALSAPHMMPMPMPMLMPRPSAPITAAPATATTADGPADGRATAPGASQDTGSGLMSLGSSGARGSVSRLSGYTYQYGGPLASGYSHRTHSHSSQSSLVGSSVAAGTAAGTAPLAAPLAGGSTATAKRGAAAYRGLAYDVAEKAAGAGGYGYGYGHGHGYGDGGEALAPLPSRWDKKGGPKPSLEVMMDGLDVKCTAAKGGTEEVYSIRADHYMPPQCGLYYFEVMVLGWHRSESTIGIGFSDASASLNRLPGWENKSWGYHSDDGSTYYKNDGTKGYGPVFGSGDIVGCGINFRTGEAFFTKNGEHLGTAFHDIKGSDDLKLYPTVGLKKAGEHIRANFGQTRFTFDIDGLMKNERLTIQKQITATSTESLAPWLSEADLVQQLVLQFLEQDGYVETARAFAEEIHTEKEALNLDPAKTIEEIVITDDVDSNNRQCIRKAILEGDIDRALELTQEHYPAVLENNKEVHFHLKCRKFIEMIRKEAELTLVGGGGSNGMSSKMGSHGRNSSLPGQQQMDVDDIDMAEDDAGESPGSPPIVDQAIAYGQKLQSEYADGSLEETNDTLAGIFSLLAYSNPLKEKEVAPLMDQRGRVTVAEELNSAILHSLGKKSRSALETLYAQTSVLLEELRQDGGPGSFVTIQGVIDQIPKPSAF